MTSFDPLKVYLFHNGLTRCALCYRFMGRANKFTHCGHAALPRTCLHLCFGRFCTEKYSLSSKNLKNRFGHLTNYSVNKKNEAFGKNTDAGNDGEGSKWSLQALLKWFEEHGVSSGKVRCCRRGLLSSCQALIVCQVHKIYCCALPRTGHRINRRCGYQDAD